MRYRSFSRPVGLHQHHGREAAERQGGDPESASQGSGRWLRHIDDGDGRRLANPCTPTMRPAGAQGWTCASAIVEGREPALAVSSPAAAPTLTRLPGQGFTGDLQGTGPPSACRCVLTRSAPCGVANTSGARPGKASALAAGQSGVACVSLSSGHSCSSAQPPCAMRPAPSAWPRRGRARCRR